MATHKLKTSVVIFNNAEYGPRLLFKNGISNTRNVLGKNGVTFHSGFGALFYNTIEIEVDLVDESGKSKSSKFNVNRNSLIKYLGLDASKSPNDDDLIGALKKQLWETDSNNGIEQQKQQINAGKNLRHAGEHNHRLIDSWTNRIRDYLKGVYRSWFYQTTIRSLTLIFARFLFVGTEAKLFEASEILAKKRFHEAYNDVPAYKNHIIRFNGVPTSLSEFCDIPVTNKDNYIKYQQFDSDTHFGGKYPLNYKTDTSTGTTGKPTQWVRSDLEIDTVKQSLALAGKLQFKDRRLLSINAFALGPWATGLTSYELMRGTGSVFATGPDKEKILDQLLSNVVYETHQLELAVAGFIKIYPLLKEDSKAIIALIDSVLKAMIKNRDAIFDDEFNLVISKLDKKIHSTLQRHLSEIKVMTETLNAEKQQVIIAGYPPFLKDLITYTQQKGHNFADFSAIGIVGGQAISEAMRDQLIKYGFNYVYSSYGASDLDINLGVETDYEIMVRKAIEKNPGLYRELCGENKGLPMVFHWDPLNYLIESDQKNNLLFTCTRSDRSSPRVRYELGDFGVVRACSDVEAGLTKYGFFQKPKINLPLLFLWGRDSTVIFNGANLAFTELERAITIDDKLEPMVLKKAFYTYQDEQGGDQLEMWLELNDGVELLDAEQVKKHTHSLLDNLLKLNQDFRYQVEKLDEGAALPMVRFFKRNKSPISEADGHRKQVLIFQKGVNLKENFQFPDEKDCIGFSPKNGIKSEMIMELKL